MSRLKTLFNVLRHPIQTARRSKAFNSLTKSPDFTDTIKRLIDDPNTRTMSFDDLESGAWKNASNAATKALTNYGDDAARLVSNYGDDAARAVTSYYDDTVGLYDDYIPSGSSYYDDALRAVDKADDFFPDYQPKSYFANVNPAGRVIETIPGGDLKIDGKTFHYPTRYSPQNALKENILNKQAQVATTSSRKFPKNITGYPDPDFTFPETTSVLGDVMLGTRRIGDGVDGVYDIEGVLNPHYVFNQTLDKPLDTAGMVIQSPELLRGIDYNTDNFAFGIRPHKNTALGRWFAKNNPNYGWDMEEPFYF